MTSFLSQLQLSKQEIQKMALSAFGFIVLIYVYFSFFLGPLNTSRAAMETKMADLRNKVGSSKDDMERAAKLEKEAGTATTRYAALQALIPDGAPIAWFPPRLKAFFANQQVDKVTARLANTAAFEESALEDWLKYNWTIDIPQADYSALGAAIAELENTDPLLTINKLTIHSLPDQPQFQQVEISASSAIQKK